VVQFLSDTLYHTNQDHLFLSSSASLEEEPPASWLNGRIFFLYISIQKYYFKKYY